MKQKKFKSQESQQDFSDVFTKLIHPMSALYVFDWIKRYVTLKAPTENIIEKSLKVAHEFEKKGIHFLEHPESTLEILNKKINKYKSHYIYKILILQNLSLAQGFTLNTLKLGDEIIINIQSKGKKVYFTLGENLEYLPLKDLVKKISRSQNEITTLTLKDIFEAYIEHLQYVDEIAKTKQKLLNVYNLLLMFRNGDTTILLKRAQLLHELGLSEKAYEDLKRYLNFQPVGSLKGPVRKFYNILKDQTQNLHDKVTHL